MGARKEWMTTAHHPPTQAVYGASQVWSWTKTGSYGWNVLYVGRKAQRADGSALHFKEWPIVWEWVTFQVGGLRNNNSAVTKAFHTLMIKRNRLARYEMLIAKLSRGSSWSPAPVVLLEGPRLVMESTSPKRASVSLCFLLYSRWPRNRKQRYWVSALSPSSCTLTQNF